MHLYSSKVDAILRKNKIESDSYELKSEECKEVDVCQIDKNPYAGVRNLNDLALMFPSNPWASGNVNSNRFVVNKVGGIGAGGEIKVEYGVSSFDTVVDDSGA